MQLVRCGALAFDATLMWSEGADATVECKRQLILLLRNREKNPGDVMSPYEAQKSGGPLESVTNSGRIWCRKVSG